MSIDIDHSLSREQILMNLGAIANVDSAFSSNQEYTLNLANVSRFSGQKIDSSHEPICSQRK